MKGQTLLATIGLIAGLGLAPGAVAAPPSALVNCNSPNASIQDAVDGATGPTTISIKGMCQQDVLLTKDDITLSGKEPNTECNKADPSASAGATIDGTITVDGVRAKIEFLEITGDGAGVIVTNRADTHLTCNDISSNDESGVLVVRTSNAVLRDNLVENNGQRDLPPATDPEDPTAHFDCGLYALDASSVASFGNTYRGNAYCAVDSDRQAYFRNGSFSPRRPGNPIDLTETDVIIQRGCAPLDVSGCDVFSGNVTAITVFNGGSVDLRNAEVTGRIEPSAGSHIRVDDHADVVGFIDVSQLSLVRLRNRNIPADDRVVTFDGTLSCQSGSQAFGSNVQCGQTCSGNIPGSCVP